MIKGYEFTVLYVLEGTSTDHVEQHSADGWEIKGVTTHPESDYDYRIWMQRKIIEQ